MLQNALNIQRDLSSNYIQIIDKLLIWSNVNLCHIHMSDTKLFINILVKSFKRYFMK